MKTPMASFVSSVELTELYLDRLKQHDEQLHCVINLTEELAMQQAEQRAHNTPVGETIVWHNPDSGNYGSVTPLRDGRHAQSGAFCREYESMVTIDGREQLAYGTACQQPDGSWDIVS